MHWSDFSWEESILDFQKEMTKGLSGERSSLSMLPTYIAPSSNFTKNKPVIVVDAGGTNLRVAIVIIEKSGQIKIEHFQKHTMPGVEREVTKKEFFDIIASRLKPIADISDRIGFCFSYPVAMQPNLDGRLLRFSKEIKAPEVEGTLIGETLLKSLMENGIEGNKKVVLLNDTVATLIAGMSQKAIKKYNDYLGFILGTGCNMAYVESTSNISSVPKLTELQIINIESGNYNSELIDGDIDKTLDSETSNPNRQLFEKKVGGGYFGKLCYHSIKLGWGTVLGLNQDEPFEDIDTITTTAISEFLSNPESEKGAFAHLKKEDKKSLYFLLDEMVTRSAWLVAMQLTAVMTHGDKGSDPLKPVCVNLDGSTIHKTHALKEKLSCFLATKCRQKKGIFYELTEVKEAPLVGAAISALML